MAVCYQVGTAVPPSPDDGSLQARRSARGHDTRQLHAMAPGLVGQTIERAGGYKAGCDSNVPAPSLRPRLWITGIGSGSWIAWQLEAEGYRVVAQAWDFGAGRDWGP